MNRSNTWKLIFTAIIAAISILGILPFEDRELGAYALTQVTSDANSSNHAGHEKFSEVIDNLRLQIPSDQPIGYSALRDTVAPTAWTMLPFSNHPKEFWELLAPDSFLFGKTGDSFGSY